MKYDIVYACGHAGVIQIYGKSADRDRKIKWKRTACVRTVKPMKTKREPK